MVLPGTHHDLLCAIGAMISRGKVLEDGKRLNVFFKFHGLVV
jgi:hypothetical protein